MCLKNALRDGEAKCFAHHCHKINVFFSVASLLDFNISAFQRVAQRFKEESSLQNTCLPQVGIAP
jgi:hypothetical protein